MSWTLATNSGGRSVDEIGRAVLAPLQGLEPLLLRLVSPQGVDRGEELFAPELRHEVRRRELFELEQIEAEVTARTRARTEIAEAREIDVFYFIGRAVQYPPEPRQGLFGAPTPVDVHGVWVLHQQKKEGAEDQRQQGCVEQGQPLC